MKKTALRVISLALCSISLLTGCKKEPEAPAHVHTFTDWTLQESSTCKKEGREDRYCTACGVKEERPIAKAPHDTDPQKICRVCKMVIFDQKSDIVELGNVVAYRYKTGAVANCPWDLEVWDGILYRAAGDYDKNTGEVPIWGYNTTDQTWKLTGEAKEEALHRFVNINGHLTSPGIDPRQGWELGNFYVLNNGSWHQYRRLPNGVHNFDIIEFDGKIFAGLGVEEGNFPCAMSADMGETFQFVPMYKDGQAVDTKGMTFIRIYEYIILRNQLYAMAYFEGDWGFYRFETDRFVYVASAADYVKGDRSSFNYINAKVEFRDTCFLVSNTLHAVKDFADASANKTVAMPNGELVADALLLDDTLYTLTYKKQADETYDTVIYKSATGEEGSFTEVLRLNYAVPSCSFTCDGGYFYIGMGSKQMIHTANGMIFRAKMP